MSPANELNLDKLQVAVIKKNYRKLKPLYEKRDKALKELQKAQQHYDAILLQIEQKDSIVHQITQTACQRTLSTEECMDILSK